MSFVGLCPQYLTNKHKVELFVLPRGFRDLNPWSGGSINLGLKNGETSWQQEYVEEEAIFFLGSQETD